MMMSSALGGMFKHAAVPQYFFYACTTMLRPARV
jgi:hypothetical protein